MKIIRWKNFILITSFTLLVLIFSIFFLDNLLKNTIISLGQSIFGAKVEIEALKTKFSDSSITITGLQIADKTDVWKNLVQIDKIEFNMQTLPLLSKKLIIDKFNIENIRWSTRRKNSGALPPKKIKKKETKSATDKLFNSFKTKIGQELQDLPVVEKAKDIGQEIKSIDTKNIVAAANFESIKTIDLLSKDSEQKYNNFKTTFDSLNLDQSIHNIQKTIDDVKNIQITKPEDLKLAQDKLTELNRCKEQLELNIVKVSIIQKEINTELSEKSKQISQIDDLIKKDYENIISQIKIPGISKGNFARAIFGPVWLNRVDKVLNYLQLARKYMPARKKTSNKSAFPRLKGTDVVFHKHEVLPGLLIKSIFISGTTGGEGKTEQSPLSLAGAITDISSDQHFTGRPTKLNITGKKSKKSYILDAVFDHTSDTPVDSITLTLNNFGIGEFAIIRNEYIPEITEGTLNMETRFILRGDELDCSMIMNLNAIKFNSTNKTDELGKILNEVFKTINNINVKAKMYGKFDNLKTELDSNLDDMITQRIQSIYNKKINELKLQIKEEVNKKTDEAKDKLLKEFTNRKDELTKLCSDKISVLQEQRNNIDKKIEEIKREIDKIQQQGKSKLEEIKKSTEEEIKQKVAPSLEKLFKK